MPLTSFFLAENLDKWFASDINFHTLYPPYIQEMAQKHWTPLKVVRKASRFLAATSGTKILDIGSGPGKFCLGGAYYNPEAIFYGIEQRNDLILHANIAKETTDIRNVNFIHGNLLDLDFKKYNHFYFFNSFYENLPGTFKIDTKLTFSRALYNQYNRYFFNQLETMPAGTRLATYHYNKAEAPHGYYNVGADINNLLKFWIKL
jgi:SAM-dependent methyltransferase